MSRILIIDDNNVDRLILKKVLTTRGHETFEATTGEEGVERVRHESFDLVLMDLIMPGISGVEALLQVKAVSPHLPVILVTVVEEAEGAIEAMRNGAHDYVIKPVEPESLHRVVDDAAEVSRMHGRIEIPEELEEPDLRERIIGRSPAMWELYKLIGQAAASDATVLLTGESGTGKELAARAIHQHSHRSDAEFLAVNCAAIPENLLESELFGHERGAFTGAERTHIGRFERARGGTIFLDEIGEMDDTGMTILEIEPDPSLNPERTGPGRPSHPVKEQTEGDLQTGRSKTSLRLGRDIHT